MEFLGFVADEDLPSYYARARALLFPGVEDFGIVPVEAISAGCPVVAFKQGGILDSMTSETAIFYDVDSPQGLKGAIEKFENSSFSEAKLKARAKEFSHGNS